MKADKAGTQILLAKKFAGQREIYTSLWKEGRLKKNKKCCAALVFYYSIDPHYPVKYLLDFNT